MAAVNPELADLSDDDREMLESWLVEFDQSWDDGILASRLEQIPPGSAWRLPALAEMVKIDLERQWQHGRRVSLESYLEQFPELGRPEDVSADLIQAEYEVRREFGAPAALEDYVLRFPHQAAELARLIDRGDSSGSRDEPRGKSSPLPATFGRYTIIKRLGQGGMGSVYLAEDTQLGRRVALKVPDLGPHEAPEARKRFLVEARAAATLDHPSICRVFEAGEIDGRPYLTMAFIEGRSLAALVAAEGWPEDQAAGLVSKLAVAMQEVHAKQVVHRDLKPANVMIKATGPRREPVIVDFGLAHRNNLEAQRLTRSGQIMGTPSYMAPEQVRGDLNQIGPACDIYALGVILYELLAGQRPFGGSAAVVAGQVLTGTPSPPSAHRLGLDPRLEVICLKAMAREIENRYRSMNELAAELTGFLDSLHGGSAPMLPAAMSVVPAGVATESLEPAARNSLVGRLLDPLRENQASPPSTLNAAPVASSQSVLHRLRPLLALLVAGPGLGVLLLGVTFTVIPDKAQVKVFVNEPTASIKLDGGAVGIKTVGAPSRNRGAPGSRRWPSAGVSMAGAGSNSPTLTKEITNSVGMTLVLIPAGRFLMGSPDSEQQAWFPAEGPYHRVWITRSFYMGIHEVTQGQYSAVTGVNPSQFQGSDDLPVENVAWTEAIAFCNKLSDREGLGRCYRSAGEPEPGGEGYRLPTEAEWEYACRAGSNTRFSFGDDSAGLEEFAWYAGNSGGMTHPGGLKRPNPWGIYDMAGNVWEWCWDWYGHYGYRWLSATDPKGPSATDAWTGMDRYGAYRVYRGGSWKNGPRLARSAARGWRPKEDLLYLVGLRVVRVASRKAREAPTATQPTDRLLPGTVWIGERTYLKGAYAVKTVTYELHVRQREGRKFKGHKFDNGPRRNRVEIEGELHGTDITWTESDANGILSMQGTLVGDTIELTFSGLFQNGRIVDGDGRLTCR